MKMQEKARQLVKTALNRQIHKEMREWPPGCLGPLYQPKRPAAPQQPAQKAK